MTCCLAMKSLLVKEYPTMWRMIFPWKSQECPFEPRVSKALFGNIDLVGFYVDSETTLNSGIKFKLDILARVLCDTKFQFFKIKYQIFQNNFKIFQKNTIIPNSLRFFQFFTIFFQFSKMYSNFLKLLSNFSKN